MSNIPNRLKYCVSFIARTIYKYGRGSHNATWRAAGWTPCLQWRTERGGLGCSKPPRNSEDIGGVLDRMSKKNRHLDFLL